MIENLLLSCYTSPGFSHFITAEGGTRMSVLGIVAEYDPFHNGHLHHLQSAVSEVSPSAVLTVLSGPFRQRGTPALLSPFSRAECALSAGADAVFALPVLWTVRDAEHYALGAVSLLSSLGATHIAFGAETADLLLLQKNCRTAGGFTCSFAGCPSSGPCGRLRLSGSPLICGRQLSSRMRNGSAASEQHSGYLLSSCHPAALSFHDTCGHIQVR